MYRSSSSGAGAGASARLGHLLALAGLAALAGCWGPAPGEFPPLDRTRIDYATHGRFFPIETSDVHSRPDCAWCHGGTSSFAEFRCTDCHEHARAEIDPRHDGVEGYFYGATGCYDCHPDGTAEGVDHEAFFPIGAGSAHGGLRCGDCHLVPGDRSVVECLACHAHAPGAADPAHAGVAGYRYETASCLACHPRGESTSRAEHDPYFPILGGRHGSVACPQCHLVPGAFTAFECIQCHEHLCSEMNPKHREVPGYDCASAECRRCHPRGDGGDRPSPSSRGRRHPGPTAGLRQAPGSPILAGHPGGTRGRTSR